jgi:hypothetical protein
MTAENVLFVRRSIRIKLFSKKKGGARLSVKTSSYKRMSSYLRASMTVEASFVLPFFLFAVLNIISIIDIYRLQGSMSASLHSSARNMAIIAYEYKEIFDSDSSKLESLGLTYAYARTNAIKELGGIYPENDNWGMSEVLQNNDIIDLVVIYDVNPPIGIIGYKTQYMFNRLRTRAWTGYDNAANSDDKSEEIVYVAETGTVYHRSRICTYIKLSISKIPASTVADERNLNQEKYSACESCGNKSSDTLYITNYGDKYHSTITCSKLKRTVSAVPISEVGNKGACSRCGGK